MPEWQKNDQGTWRPEGAKKDSLEGKSGTWFVSLDTVITIPAGADPDSAEFRNEARQKLMAMLEANEFDLVAEFEEEI